MPRPPRVRAERTLAGGGRIGREYALGRGRTDLAVIWPHAGDEQRIVIEVKVAYAKNIPATRLEEGLDQAVAYGDSWPGAELDLLLFDRRPGVPWEERCRNQTRQHRGRTVQVWGM